TECRSKRRKDFMKRIITLATVLLVGLASVQAAQTDDQQKKKKKKAQTTTQATPAPKKGGTQTSNRRVSTQTTKPHVSSQTTSSQTSKKHVTSQPSSNQQVTNRYYKNKKGQSNVAAIFGYGYAAPGDVTVEVQRALAQRGYYYGPIDGILGPGTRRAIQRYQIDRGLAVTAAIDEQTLYTLGLA